MIAEVKNLHQLEGVRCHQLLAGAAVALTLLKLDHQQMQNTVAVPRLEMLHLMREGLDQSKQTFDKSCNTFLGVCAKEFTASYYIKSYKPPLYQLFFLLGQCF